MPHIIVPFLNNLPAFQAIMQSKNVSETKRVLIETVTQMNTRRWNQGYFASACRAEKHKAESDLLTALKASSSMDEIKRALHDYKKKFNDFQHLIHQGSNTSAFMKGIAPLIGQANPLEKISKADNTQPKTCTKKPEACEEQSSQYGDKNPQLSSISTTRKPSANIPESIFIDIGDAMKKAGYHPNEEGMCYGIVWTALLACVRQDGRTYMERMQYLKQMYIPPLRRADAHQVHAFFDAVTLSQTNYENMSGYAKGIGYPGRQEMAFPGSIIGSDEPGYQVPITKHFFIVECTHEKFIQFLRQTRKTNKDIPFGVMVCYQNHAISIGFDGKKWLAADSSIYFYTKSTELLHIFLRGQSAYQKDGYIIASVEMVTDNKYSIDIDNGALLINAKKSVSVSQALYIALRIGDVKVTVDCIAVISQQSHSSKTLFKLLTCKHAKKIPGLYMALQNGHSRTITVFIMESAAVVTTLSMSDDEIADFLYKLLASKRADGVPGFLMSLQNGHSDAIIAFIQASTSVILKLNLPEKRKAELMYELLASKHTDGTPGFFIALQNGYSDAIRAFIQTSAQAIATLLLPDTQKAELLRELLASKRVDGLPGFFMTLQHSPSEAIIAFIQASAQAIATLTLPETEKAELLYELLASKSADGTPGFFMTLQRSHSDTITAFIQTSAAVMLTFSLTEKRETKLLYKLLASKRADDATGFFMTLQNGHSSAISRFIHASTAAIATLPLSEKQKFKLMRKLLASKNDDGIPGFFMTLQSGHCDAITAFIQASATAIATFSLPEEQKAELLCELLASKTANGIPGFFMTLQNGYTDAITIFIQESAAAIAGFSLSKEEKTKWLCELLVSKKANGTPGFHVTLENGHSKAITAFIQASVAVIAESSLSEQHKTNFLCELLTSKAANGTPGFCMTLQNGHTDAITAFVNVSTKVMAALPMSEERKAELLGELLASKRADDTPGFFMTLHLSHPGATIAFIKASMTAIFRFSLSKEEKARWLYDLLACKRANGAPGFFMALQDGYTDTIIAFIKASATAIVTFPLPQERKVKLLYELLISKRRDGMPGFSMALQSGHTDAITAFVQVSAESIASLDLTEKQKSELIYKLLVSKDDDGIPGFLIALYRGHFNTITAFIKASAVAMAILFESEKERAEQLYALFDIVENDNKLNFSLALKQGGPAVKKAFAEGIDYLPLSTEQKEILKYPVEQKEILKYSTSIALRKVVGADKC